MSTTPDIASIEFVHPESDLVVGRLLSVLEEKSPVQGFYHHLLDGLDSIHPGQTTPLGTVTHVLAWPTVSPTPSQQQRGHHTLHSGDSIPTEVPVVNQRNLENGPPPSIILQTVELAIPETARFAETDSGPGQLRSVTDVAQGSESSASSIEAIFNHEGKWEVLNEEELLADKETEHSKSGSSYSSSHGSQTEHPETEADTTAAAVAGPASTSQAAPVSTRGVSHSSASCYDLRASSPLIAEGYRRFPSVYTSFVLSVPPSRLQTLLQMPETVSFNEILGLSNQLYCNPHLLQGILTYLQVQVPFREWCGKLVLGHPQSSAHTVGVIASTLSPEILPQVETGTPHHVPMTRPVSPHDFVGPVVTPPPSMPGSPSHPVHDLDFKSHPEISTAQQVLYTTSLRPNVQSPVDSSVTYVPLQINAQELDAAKSGTPEMIPTPRASPKPRHRIKMADSKLMSIHGVHRSPLSPSCRVIEVLPGQVIAHTAASASAPQTTILRTGGVTVATTIEVSDADFQGAVATTQTTRLDMLPSRHSDLHLPTINSIEALAIDQSVRGRDTQQIEPIVTAPSPLSDVSASPMARGSPAAVTTVTSYLDEWYNLSGDLIAPAAAFNQVTMLSPQVLEETLKILEFSLRERVSEVEIETQRRLELLYTTGRVPPVSPRRTTLFVPQTPRSMSPRNILRLVIGELAFFHTLRRFVKRALKSVEIEPSAPSSSGVLAMLSDQLSAQKRDMPAQLEGFLQSSLSRTLSHSLMVPQYTAAAAATSIASIPDSIIVTEPMISYVRPVYDHHSFGGSHLDIKDSVVASDWQVDSRITSR